MQVTWTLAGLWLLHSAAAGSLVLLVTLVWMRLVRQPARRQRLGEIGLTAALLAAAAALGPAWLHLPWLPADQSDALASRPDTPVKKPVAQASTAIEMESDGVEWFAWAPVEQIKSEPADNEDTAKTTSLATPTSEAAAMHGSGGLGILNFVSYTIVYTVLIAYGLGAAFFLARWLSGWIGLRRILSQAEPAPDDIRGFFRSKTALEPAPRLLMSRRLRVPVSCGVWQPTIVLPVSLCRPPDHGRLPWVFAHELTHLVRHDAWSSILFALGQVVFFYLPWFWTLRRQVRLCQEYVADAAAVNADSVGGRPADEYAEFLLSLIASQAVPLAATGVSGNRSDLYRRVSMLLKSPTRVEQHCPRSWAWASAAVLVALAVVIGGVGLTAEAGSQGSGGRIIVIEQRDGQQPLDVFKFKSAPDAVVFQDPVPAEGQPVIVREIDPEGAQDVFIQKSEDGKKTFLFKFDLGQHAKLAARAAQDKPAIILDLEASPQIELFIPKLELKPFQVKPLHGNLLKLKDVILELHPGEQADKDKQEKELADLLKMIEKLGGQDGEKLRKQVEEALQKATKKIQSLDMKALGIQGKVRDALGQTQRHAEWSNWQDPMALSRGVWAFGSQGPGRLGAKLVKPSAILSEQLNLPKGMGMVVQEVQPDSPAAKAGMKVNDILLLNQDVLTDSSNFNKLLESQKKDGNLELRVIRKGKEEGLKGIAIAELQPKQHQDFLFSVPAEGATWAFGRASGRGHGVVTTTFRNNDRFNTRHQEGSLIITIVGRVESGKATPQEIHIQDGNTSNRYDNVERVPAQYRDKVNHLIQTSGGPTQVESK